MSRTPEGLVKDKVVRVLREGIYYFFPATGGYGRGGVPDIICCVAGNFLAIECKAQNNTPTSLQIREMGKICKAGGLAVVIDEENIDIVRPILKKLLSK